MAEIMAHELALKMMDVRKAIDDLMRDAKLSEAGGFVRFRKLTGLQYGEAKAFIHVLKGTNKMMDETFDRIAAGGADGLGIDPGFARAILGNESETGGAHPTIV